MTTYLTTAQVVAIHNLESAMPIRDQGILDAAVNAPRATWNGTPLRADLLQQAAALLAGITQAQAFIDGNKRTAWITADVFLVLNHRRLLDIPTAEILELMDGISSGSIDELGIARWFRDRTAPGRERTPLQPRRVRDGRSP